MADVEKPQTKPFVDSSLQTITLCIDVPAPFKDYLVRRRQAAWKVYLAVVALGAFISWRHRPVRLTDLADYLHILMYLMIYMVWRINWREQAKRKWRYEFGTWDAKLVTFEFFDWAWYHLKWAENPYVGFEYGQWEGLPAVTISRRSRFPWQRKRFLMVYSPEEAAIVENQVVPFMAKRGTLTSEDAWYRSRS